MDIPKNADKSLIFYDYPSSPCARRVRISLFEKDLPHHIALVDLGKQEQKTPAFKQVNPWGKVPALIEAVALNYADDTDAKMETFKEILENNSENSGWLGYNRLFESNLRATRME